MVTLYGIKNCDTVKNAREWLTKNNIDYRFHDFRADGLSEDNIANWITEIGLDVLINKRSTTWKELDETTKKSINEMNAVTIIAEHPTLIKRPVLDLGTKKIIGFKDADYAKIFS